MGMKRRLGRREKEEISVRCGKRGKGGGEEW